MMKIALCQTAPIYGQSEVNLPIVEQWVASAEADLVVLPEMFATGYVVDRPELAEPMSGPTVRAMRRWAKDYNKAVVGSVFVSQLGRLFNRMVVAMPDGTLCSYDKHHLFSFAGEDQLLRSGEERIIVNFGGVRILPLCCYDLRFPAWSYLPAEVDLIIYSASWSVGRIEAWDALLPARAIENQAYVVGVNRAGSDPTAEYNGHSALYDFFGRKIADAGETVGVVVGEIDREALDAYRSKFRAWQDADKFEFNKK